MMHGTGTAAFNLRKDLEKYVRPVFSDKIKVDSIFNPIKKYITSVAESADPDQIMDHLVDRYIDEGESARLLGRLLDTIMDREHYTDQEALRILHLGLLTAEHREKIESIKDEYGKMVFSYLSKIFNNFARQYFDQIKKRAEVHDAVQKDIGEISEQEFEEEEQSQNEFSWETGLIEATLDFLKRRVHDEKKRALYYTILSERIMPEKKKTLGQLEKELGVSDATINRAEKILHRLLREFYQSRPDIQKFIGPGIFKEEEFDPPDYREFLKEEVDKKSLYAWLKGRFRSDKEQPGETTLFVLKELSEGKTVKEISNDLEKDTQYVQLVKTRYFNNGYEAWYRDWKSLQLPGNVELISSP